MTQEFIIIVVSIVVGMFLTLGLPILVNKLKGNPNIGGIFDSSEYLIKLLDMLVNSSKLDPTTKQIYNLISTSAKEAVQYAEQLFKNGSIDKEERILKATEYVKLVLKESGVDITPEREELIKGAIEASVVLLPKTSTIKKVKKN